MREPQFSTDDAHSDRFYTALAGQLLMETFKRNTKYTMVYKIRQIINNSTLFENKKQRRNNIYAALKKSILFLQ